MTGSRLLTGRGGKNAEQIAGCTRAALAALLLFVPSLSGCGSNGTSIAGPGAQDQQIEEKVTGTVFAPNGVIAANHSWWEMPRGFGLVSPAYALRNTTPVGSGVPVSFVKASADDALNGELDEGPMYASLLLLNPAFTKSDGRYTFIHEVARDVEDCGKMVEVGSRTSETLTRAFVFSHDVDIDANSEAVVRLVLDRITNSTAGLCDFDTDTLTLLSRAVREVTQFATGDNVATVNADAYNRAKRSSAIQKLLESIG